MARQECHVIRFSQSEMTSTIGVGCIGEVKTRKNQEVAWAEFLTFNKPVFYQQSTCTVDSSAQSSTQRSLSEEEGLVRLTSLN